MTAVKTESSGMEVGGQSYAAVPKTHVLTNSPLFPFPVSGYTWGEKLLTVGREFMFHAEPANKT